MSNIKNLAVSIDPNVKARDIRGLANRSSNIYESISVITRRARQLSNDLKKELHDKLEEFVVVTETIEEIHENKEQIEISALMKRWPAQPFSPLKNLSTVISNGVIRNL